MAYTPTMGGSGGGSPTGPAGGDLRGTYPDPLVKSITGDDDVGGDCSIIADSFTWIPGATPLITQATPSVNGSGALFTIRTQAPKGDNSSPGSLAITIPSPIGYGSNGAVTVNISSANVITIDTQGFLFGKTINPRIAQDNQVGDSPTYDFNFQSQTPAPASTGTNRNPGNIVFSIPTPAAGGSSGKFSFNISSLECVAILATGIQFEKTSSYTISQAPRTINAATHDLTIQTQAPYASAVGSNGNPGNLIFTIPAANANGTAGKISVNISGSEVCKITSTSISFGEAVNNPTITQTDRGSNAQCNNIYIISQAPNAGALGIANQSSGSIMLQTAPAVGSGSPGQINCYYGGGNLVFQIAATINALVNYSFAATFATPKFLQAPTVTPGVTAYPLTIQAQNATGGGNATGGQLILTSGTGDLANGTLLLQNGGSTKLSITATAVTPYAKISFEETASYGIYQNIRTSDAVTHDLTIQSQASYASATGANANPGNIVIAVPAPVGAGTAGKISLNISGNEIGKIETTGLTFTSTLSTPKIYQNDKTANSNTGESLTIAAQNETGTGSTGGTLYLTSGTGTSAPGGVQIQTGAFTRLQLSGTQATWSLTTVCYAATTSTPIFKQLDKTTASGTGESFTIQAQNETGTTSTGGALILTSGSGTTAAGQVLIKTGGTTQITIGPSSIGFYGTAAQTKQTVVGSRGSNAALTSLLTALSTLGLITDSSS